MFNGIYYIEMLIQLEKNKKRIRRSQLWRSRQKTKLRRGQKLLNVAEPGKENCPQSSETKDASIPGQKTAQQTPQEQQPETSRFSLKVTCKYINLRKII